MTFRLNKKSQYFIDKHLNPTISIDKMNLINSIPNIIDFKSEI